MFNETRCVFDFLVCAFISWKEQAITSFFSYIHANIIKCLLQWRLKKSVVFEKCRENKSSMWTCDSKWWLKWVSGWSRARIGYITAKKELWFWLIVYHLSCRWVDKQLTGWGWLSFSHSPTTCKHHRAWQLAPSIHVMLLLACSSIR